MSVETTHLAGEHAAGFGVHEVFGLITLGIVFAIFYFGARKSIVEALRSKSAETKARLDDTRTRLESANKKLEKAKSDLVDIDNIRKKMLGEVEAEARALGEQILTDAKNSANRVIQDAKISAQNETRKALKELRSTLVNEALGEAAKLAGGEKNKEVHQKLSQDLIGGA
jgi:F-type H+-transporting ATPase subunit b